MITCICRKKEKKKKKKRSQRLFLCVCKNRHTLISMQQQEDKREPGALIKSLLVCFMEWNQYEENTVV